MSRDSNQLEESSSLASAMANEEVTWSLQRCERQVQITDSQEKFKVSTKKVNQLLKKEKVT